ALFLGDADMRVSMMSAPSLGSPATIAAAIQDAQAAEANTLVVPLRALAVGNAFDPLAEAIALGHAAGLKVHASINVAVAVPFGIRTDSITTRGAWPRSSPRLATR